MAATEVARPGSGMAMEDRLTDTRAPSPAPRNPKGSEENLTSNGVIPNGDQMEMGSLSSEVQMLSTKLVHAINHNTNLDDQLQTVRMELEQSRQDLARARAEKRSLDDAITRGVLLRKAEVDKTIEQLRNETAEARLEREKAEKGKKQVEAELEALTVQLFEEANSMVAQARKETETVERRNSQLRSQLSDTEVLLASQQEQLHDLKLSLERLDSMNASQNSLPSTPINPTAATFDATNLSPHAGARLPEIPPDHPLAFSQLLSSVLRTDVSSYADFAELLTSARRTAPHSRNASGNMTSQAQAPSSSSASVPAGPNGSPSLPGAFSFGSGGNSPSSSNFHGYIPPLPLKESKFYKRVLIEDIEPTLRLDLAPGLSFLSRRTVTSSLLSGSLVVEPFAPSVKFFSPVFACALCGESRKHEPHTRKHRFRTSESDDAQRYPLCDYCLNRVRATGDFVGFLRMVRDGHWKCESEAEEKGAWEEAVRLRERMFWARIGGGVLPRVLARAAPESSPGRTSLDNIPEGEQLAERRDMQASPDVFAGTAQSSPSHAGVDHVPELQPPQRRANIESPRINSQDEQDGANAQLQQESYAASSLDVPPPDEDVFRTPDPSPVAEESDPVKDQGHPPSPTRSIINTFERRYSSPEKPNLETRRSFSPSKASMDSKRSSSPVKTSLDRKRSSSLVKMSGGDGSVDDRRMSSRASERPSLAPASSPENERRPSASSVLARVRAMEAKSSG